LGDQVADRGYSVLLRDGVATVGDESVAIEHGAA
jgi:hypothetical protein